MIALDKTTIAALREHRFRQQAERAAAGTRWAETGYVFTTQAGKPVGPNRMTRLFRKLVAASGLPPVTLHGLRHGAATLALAAGTDLKIVQDQLGHSTITLTADTYTSVLPQTARTAADNTAALLFPASARRAARRDDSPEGREGNPSRPGRGAATDRIAEVAPLDGRTGISCVRRSRRREAVVITVRRYDTCSARLLIRACEILRPQPYPDRSARASCGDRPGHRRKGPRDRANHEL